MNKTTTKNHDVYKWREIHHISEREYLILEKYELLPHYSKLLQDSGGGGERMLQDYWQNSPRNKLITRVN